MENNIKWAAIIVTALITISGWYIVSFLDKRESRKSKQLELRTQYLESAYMSFAEVSLSGPTPGNLELLNEAIRKVNLYGSNQLVKNVNNWIKELSEEKDKSKPIEFDPILKNFRNELRTELGLTKLPDSEPISWIKYLPKSDTTIIE